MTFEQRKEMIEKPYNVFICDDCGKEERDGPRSRFEFCHKCPKTFCKKCVTKNLTQSKNGSNSFCKECITPEIKDLMGMREIAYEKFQIISKTIEKFKKQ